MATAKKTMAKAAKPAATAKKTAPAAAPAKTVASVKPIKDAFNKSSLVTHLAQLAAVDANAHQEVGIMQVVNLFEDDANFDRLRACTTAQQVLDLIDETSAAAAR